MPQVSMIDFSDLFDSDFTVPVGGPPRTNTEHTFSVVYFNGTAEVETEPIFKYENWHYVVLTVDSDNGANQRAKLYVDGVRKAHSGPESRNYHSCSLKSTADMGAKKVLNMTDLTDMYPTVGNLLRDVDEATGFFDLGRTGAAINIGPYAGLNDSLALAGEGMYFEGYLEEVKVLQRTLSASDIEASMFAPLPYEGEVGLLAYYTFDEYVSTPTFPYTNGTWGDACGAGECPAAYGDAILGEGPLRLPPVVVAPGESVLDTSANGMNGVVVGADLLGIEYRPYPGSYADIAAADPGTVHVQGGCLVNVTGLFFAPSEFLACKFGEHVVPAQYLAESSIVCQAPPMTEAAHVNVEVTNNGYVFQHNEDVSVGFLEMGIEFDGCDDMLVSDNVAADLKLSSEGYTVGTWLFADDKDEYHMPAPENCSTIVFCFNGGNFYPTPIEAYPPFQQATKYFDAANGVGGTQRRLLGAAESSARRLLQTDPEEDPQIAQQLYTAQRVPGSDTLWTVTWTWTYNTDITGFEMSFNATGGSLTEDQLATIVSFEYGDPVMLNLTRREAAQVTNVTEPGTIKAAANSFDYTQFRLYVDCNETIGSAENVCVEVYTTVAYVITKGCRSLRRKG
eukprot:scaffold1398_cov366-Prasinococcus_capsulatus_cf.AAC.2